MTTRENQTSPGTTRSKTVTRNVSRLLGGTDEVLTPAWLHSLASDPAGTSVSAYNEIQKRQTSLQVYLGLQNDTDALKSAIARRRQGPKPELVLKARETDEAAVCEMAQDYPGRSQAAPARSWRLAERPKPAS